MAERLFREVTITLTGAGEDWTATVSADGTDWAEIWGSTQGDTAHRAAHYATVHLATPQTSFDDLLAPAPKEEEKRG